MACISPCGQFIVIGFIARTGVLNIAIGPLIAADPKLANLSRGAAIAYDCGQSRIHLKYGGGMLSITTTSAGCSTRVSVYVSEDDLLRLKGHLYDKEASDAAVARAAAAAVGFGVAQAKPTPASSDAPMSFGNFGAAQAKSTPAFSDGPMPFGNFGAAQAKPTPASSDDPMPFGRRACPAQSSPPDAAPTARPSAKKSKQSD